MENNLANFQLKQVLNSSQTERTLYLLGTVKDQPGQAIAVISPKLHDPSQLAFSNIETIFNNDIYYRFVAQLPALFDIQFIFPCNQKHKLKYKRKQMSIAKQTGKEYEQKKQALLTKELAHIQWVTNIIEGKTQVDRVLFKCAEFLICQDFKWDNIKEVSAMHLTVIFSNPLLHTIRDLRAEHISLLQQVQKSLAEVLEARIRTTIDQCRMFFHYPPTFYQLHVHVMSLSLESLNCRVERCHDLGLVIQNLKLKGDYYKDITLNTFIEK